MGAVWNRYGEPGGSLGEDWPRTLAHELGHYLLYLDDNYLGLDASGVLIPIDTCPGAMADPYRDDYSEFHPDAGWLPACASTLSNLETGRSDWATIGRFYDGLTMPAAFGSQPGPRSLPLAVTQIQVIDPATAPATLDVPIFYLTDANDASTQAGNSARAFLLQDDWLTDLGRPTVGEVRARGARPGDRLCVFEPERDRQGCETITAGDDLLRLVSVPDWQPEIVVSPVTSTTITVRVGKSLPASPSAHGSIPPRPRPRPASPSAPPLVATKGPSICPSQRLMAMYTSIPAPAARPSPTIPSEATRGTCAPAPGTCGPALGMCAPAPRQPCPPTVRSSSSAAISPLPWVSSMWCKRPRACPIRPRGPRSSARATG